MKKVGILGGTFNPVHNAHLAMAQAALEQYGLDRVLFMPSKNPPHKKKEEIVSEEHRRRMIKNAIQGMEKFRFSDFELNREGTTYTSDTLKLLKEKHPNWDIYFILGGDSLSDFLKWHEPENIVRYSTVLAAPREDMKFSETKKMCEKISAQLFGKVLPFHMKQLPISSRQIRKKFGKGETLTGICPDSVCRYIRLHGLYGTMPLICPAGLLEEGNWDNLYENLSSTLPKKRYIHSLGVADTALLLASRYRKLSEADARRIKLAGLLHDCAKYITGQEAVQLCESNTIPVSPVERSNSALLHGKLGAHLAKTRYGIRDTEILSAIQYHTTGRPDMGFMEKVIFIADFIEPNRNMPCEPYPLGEIRHICFQDIDRGLLCVLQNILSHLETMDVIDNLTKTTYDYYKRRVTI